MILRSITILIIAIVAVACRASGVRPRAESGRVSVDTISRDLALATFDSAWGKIQALHYDSMLNGVNWTEVRATLRPRAELSRSTQQLREVLNSMLATLGESHFTLIPREASVAFSGDPGAADVATPGDLGMEMRLVEGAPLITMVESDGPAYAAGIRAGWSVTSIGDLDVKALLATLDSTSNPLAKKIARTRLLLRLQAAARGAAGTRVALVATDLRGKEQKIPLTRRVTPGERVKYGNLPTVVARVSAMSVEPRGGNGCIGVIRFNTWMPAVASRIDEAVDSVRSCNGVVLDLRGNTGGVANMVVGISGHFLTGRDTLGTMKMRSAVLRLIANPRLSNAKGERVQPFTGRVALVVDELSASTSEIFAGALQALGRARVFGDTTAGQALPSTLYRLPNEDVLMLAVADFRGPRGERIEGKGVVPDVVVKIDRDDLIRGRDAVVESALLWITSAAR